MDNSKLLESYKNGELRNVNSDTLDKISQGLKSKIIDFINEEFFKVKLTNQNTIKNLTSNLDKFLISEHNSLTIPYFYILESLNLCIEVEMSDEHSKYYENKKFGELKISDILNNGIENPQPIKKFAVSEKEFLSKISMFIENYTDEYKIEIDSIKIDFF